MDTILGIPLGESYSGIRVLADLSVFVKIYQHRFISAESSYGNEATVPSTYARVQATIEEDPFQSAVEGVS